jgi:hypothetical protein
VKMRIDYQGRKKENKIVQQCTTPYTLLPQL